MMVVVNMQMHSTLLYSIEILLYIFFRYIKEHSTVLPSILLLLLKIHLPILL